MIKGLSGKQCRGNPNWGRPQIPPSLSCQEKPGMFALFLGELGIPEEGCARYAAVQNWVRKNAKLYYIPEDLLRECHAELGSGDSL